MERRQQRRREMPTKEELRAVFHRIWTSQVSEHGYSKRDWRELQQMIFRLTKLEL